MITALRFMAWAGSRRSRRWRSAPHSVGLARGWQPRVTSCAGCRAKRSNEPNAGDLARRAVPACKLELPWGGKTALAPPCHTGRAIFCSRDVRQTRQSTDEAAPDDYRITMEGHLTQHISSEHPRVMVVDGSKVVRKLIEQLLRADLPGVVVLACETGAEAKQQLETGVVDLITTALRLPDMDGLELAKYVREHAPQAYIPIVIVSGDVNERLINRELSEHGTDYFDKSLGFNALSAFIRGYVRPQGQVEG